MERFQKRFWVTSSALVVPLLTLAHPTWLTLSGIAPAWSVLWLLPWALEFGSGSGVIAGMSIGLVLDGLSLGGASHLPALILLGFWWGRFGKRGQGISLSLNLGLLALLGTMVLGSSLLIQQMLLQLDGPIMWFRAWGIYSLLAQAVLSGLVAPMFCSWLLLFFRRRIFV